VTEALITDTGCDFADTPLPALKKAGGKIDAGTAKILVNSYSGHTAEGTTKVTGTAAYLTCEARKV
jgi:hypothetical protein